jgi:hypothetical protein
MHFLLAGYTWLHTGYVAHVDSKPTEFNAGRKDAKSQRIKGV